MYFRNFEHLIPDAPELIHDFLVNEKDASCKRNAFMMLIHADQVCSLVARCAVWSRFCCLDRLKQHHPSLQDRALDYLSTCIDQVHTFGDILQLVIVELIYKVGQRADLFICIDPELNQHAVKKTTTRACAVLCGRFAMLTHRSAPVLSVASTICCSPPVQLLSMKLLGLL